MQRANDTDEVAQPQILDYLDVRSFIRDSLQYLQKQDSKYSQRWLAKQAGIKSPHLLSMIIAGKRNLTREHTSRLAKSLKLDQSETEYFEIIADLSQADDPQMRKELLEKIKVSFRNGLFKSISYDNLEILKEWYIPAIRELTSLKNFQFSNQWIAQTLKISCAEVEEAIRILKACQFLVEENEALVRSEPSIHNHEKCPPMLIGKYQLQMIDKAFQAASLPHDKRYFECLTFAMPKRLQPHLREAIKRFCREIDTLVESHTDREEVYQLNIQLFPLTDQSPTHTKESHI